MKLQEINISFIIFGNITTQHYKSCVLNIQLSGIVFTTQTLYNTEPSSGNSLGFSRFSSSGNPENSRGAAQYQNLPNVLKFRVYLTLTNDKLKGMKKTTNEFQNHR